MIMARPITTPLSFLGPMLPKITDLYIDVTELYSINYDFEPFALPLHDPTSPTITDRCLVV